MRGWGQAGALFLATLVLSVFAPVPLVLIPFACLVFVLPGRRLLPVLVGVLAMLLALGGGEFRSGLWYVERGWAIILGGCFAALSLRRPEQGFFPRGLLAVVLALGGSWAALGLSRRRWGVIDDMVASRLRDGVGTSLEALRVLRDGAPLPGTVVSTVFQAAEWQSHLFPAMLALSSLAALGVAWWLYARLVRGSGDGLGPLSGFRFSDQLIWVFVLGAVLVLLQPDDVPGRAGLNLLLLSGALYVVRGAGVVAGVSRGLSVFGWTLLVLGFLLLAPFLLVGALLIGLGDNWLDIRARTRNT